MERMRQRPEIEGKGGAGLFTASGKPVLEPPPRELLARLEGERKVEYVPFRFKKESEREVVNREFLLDEERSKAKMTEYAELKIGWLSEDGIGPFILTAFGDASEAIVAKIKEEFKGKLPVAVRGTVCSLGGPVNTAMEGCICRIKGIGEVLESGTEKEKGAEFALTGVDESSDKLQFKTYKWLLESAQNLRKTLAGEPESARLIFPVLLVYDPSKLVPAGRSGVYGTALLPESNEEARKALLKIYVLDYPYNSIDTAY